MPTPSAQVLQGDGENGRHDKVSSGQMVEMQGDVFLLLYYLSGAITTQQLNAYV